ncbi:MAG TPA: Ku protein [bacterium]|jgi:DNA end-binding protein Ku|nr:Ku protein [bacterium]
MRPIWSGAISFGLVTVPVKLYTAVSTKRVVAFRLLDSRDLTPIKEVRVNAETGKEVAWEDVVRGVEVGKDEFVPVTDEELKALPLPSAHTIELMGFADAEEIDAKYFDALYYLGPGNGGDRAYALLHRVLADSGKVGIGHIMIRMREHLAAVMPTDGVLAVQTLFYADEVRQPDEVPGIPEDVRIHANERKMATQLLSSMEMKFEPEESKSEFKDALRQLVKAKEAGKELPAPKRPGKVVDLQEALKRSLAEAGKGPRKKRRKAG